jgi:hypothetical protein
LYHAKYILYRSDYGLERSGVSSERPWDATIPNTILPQQSPTRRLRHSDLKQNATAEYDNMGKNLKIHPTLLRYKTAHNDSTSGDSGKDETDEDDSDKDEHNEDESGEEASDENENKVKAKGEVGIGNNQLESIVHVADGKFICNL